MKLDVRNQIAEIMDDQGADPDQAARLSRCGTQEHGPIEPQADIAVLLQLLSVVI
jgi:hypothetical protein